jgi:hypothetical protein
VCADDDTEMSKYVAVYIINRDTLVIDNCVLVCRNKTLVDHFQPYVLEEKLEIYCAHFRVFICDLHDDAINSQYYSTGVLFNEEFKITLMDCCSSLIFLLSWYFSKSIKENRNKSQSD